MHSFGHWDLCIHIRYVVIRLITYLLVTTITHTVASCALNFYYSTYIAVNIMCIYVATLLAT